MEEDIESKFDKIELNQKEQLIEFMAIAIAALLIGGCFMKVMFF